MALKKSQLYSSLWRSCDELRGGMDASQYKDYVLTLLFVKYVSDKYAGQPDAPIIIPPGGSFADMIALKGKPEIGDGINKIIGKLAEANELTNVITQADFNDASKLGGGSDMKDRLTKLVGIFQGLDFRGNRVEGDDLLGDAYEYLMRHFATESGKSKGQFYTPAEVSRIMAKIIGIGPRTRQDQTVYDPTCGSGSLLLKAAAEAPNGISIYGQENDNATWALARMNMILHGQPTHEIWKDNTLSTPHFRTGDGLKSFDFAVANPPFSAKAWTNGFDPKNDVFKRFEYGIPPARNGDYAFLLHVIKSLKSTAKGAVILPHGVLFRGHREAEIRRNLIRRGLIKAIIGLPPNLFYGTGIPACIVVIDKEAAATRTELFMIDASRGFRKDGAKNRLREQDIRKAVDVFRGQTEVPGYSRRVPLSEIEDPKNDYNLNLSRYIDASVPEDIHDLDGHLRGGIPVRDLDALGKYWEVFPTLRNQLFERGDRPGYDRSKVPATEVASLILSNAEFQAYRETVRKVFLEWRAAHEPALLELTLGSAPAQLISVLSDDLLGRFSSIPLLDQYDVYQRLMEYWEYLMQDDVFLIHTEDWTGATRPRLVIEDKDRGIKETADLAVNRKKYKMDLLPPRLIISQYFSAGEAGMPMLEAKRVEAAAALTEFVEEHSGEDGALEDVVNEKGVVTKAAAKARLKELTGLPELEEERAVLTKCLALIDGEAAAEKAIHELEAKVLAKYADLTLADVKDLVVRKKWLAAIAAAVDDEIDKVTRRLAHRVSELDERYVSPLPAMEREAQTRGEKVHERLRQMGFAWA
jgi:type I restriction enzyme M protein